MTATPNIQTASSPARHGAGQGMMCVLMMNCQGGLLTKHLPEHVLQRFCLTGSKRSDF